MVIMDYLEKNARLHPSEVALVEINPALRPDRTTWKEFDLIEAFQERIQIYLDQNMVLDQAYKVLIYSLEPLNECRKLKKTEEDNNRYKQAVEKTKYLIRQLKHAELSGIQKYSLVLIQMNPCLVFSMAMKCRGILERFI